MKEVDRENEVNRILGAFKLNPYEMLGLKFTATDDDIKRAYRKVSLAVHPDKCSHPRSKDAFEIIGHAQKELLNEEKRKSLDFLLGVAKEEVQKEWKKAAKHDAAARLAAVLDESGKSGVEAGWEQTAEFHEAWKIKARDVLAKAEWRRRKMTKRVKEEEERAKEEHKQEKEENKKKREADKDWESGRDERIGSWRNFVSGGGKKTKKNKKRGSGGSGSGGGGLKPPKAKTNDEDKRYVQRPVGEQFRPPPPSAPPRY
jgi:DnaJ homolog subfamily C member 8